MRKLVVGLLKTALMNLYEVEGKGANDRIYEKDQKE
jgi:hypothetical protein